MPADPMFLVILHKMGGEVTITQDYAENVLKEYGHIETIKGNGSVSYKIVKRSDKNSINIATASEVDKFGK